MYGKLIIGCELVVRTGMHIGGSSVFSAIGAVDSPVASDPGTGMPIVPGSSLKGKMRTLLARSKNKNADHLPAHNNDDVAIRRLFGSSKPVQTARLQFTDAFVANNDKMKELKDKMQEAGLTEIKSENTINRENCVAIPRQIERVIPRVRFDVRLVYDLFGQDQEIIEDMTLLAKGFRLLQMDYLGGYGTRGSGRVSFEQFHFDTFEADIDLDAVKAIFKDVENYELLPV